MTRIAVFQACSGVDPRRNGEELVAAVEAAAAGGAQMLFTPEMSGMLDRDRKRARANARAEKDDEVLAAVMRAAAANGIWVNLGSLAILLADGRFANRGFVIDPNGAIRARYDKLHLFDIDLPSGESWRESAAYRPGERAVIVEGTPLGRLGLAICYDLRFAELFTQLAQGGAQAISVPSAFTVPTGRAHWHVLLRARAIESALFVIAAAQSGSHEDGRLTYGHSLVVDPWGQILLDMGEEAGVGFVDLMPERVAEVRAQIPVLGHRRAIPEVELAR